MEPYQLLEALRNDSAAAGYGSMRRSDIDVSNRGQVAR